VLVLCWLCWPLLYWGLNGLIEESCPKSYYKAAPRLLGAYKIISAEVFPLPELYLFFKEGNISSDCDWGCCCYCYIPPLLSLKKKIVTLWNWNFNFVKHLALHHSVISNESSYFCFRCHPSVACCDSRTLVQVCVPGFASRLAVTLWVHSDHFWNSSERQRLVSWCLPVPIGCCLPLLGWFVARCCLHQYCC
jgi:hypothetical protein